MHRSAGLVCCPITLIETAPQFAGNIDETKEFITSCDIDCQESWSSMSTTNSLNAWARYSELKRKGLATKRPIADILIGGFAESLEGLITRNEIDFRPAFPKLKIIGPTI